MSYKGLLFDFDGTLARTMEDHFRAWQYTFARYGLNIEPMHLYPLEGMALPKIAERLSLLQAGNYPPPTQIVKEKEEYYLNNHRLEFYPGVENLVHELNVQKIPIGIVTAAPFARFERSVPVKFLEQFNAVITGDKYARGKPFPDPYLMGAQELKLEPHECIVVENAPMGIQSGRSAGAYCIAITSTLDASYFGEAHEVVDTFNDLVKCAAIKELRSCNKKN